MILVIPPTDEPEWPSLGPLIWKWIQTNLCHGPGDLLGEPIEMDEEWYWFLWRAYQVWPQDHQWAGRRRFKRAALSRRKGRAKTELAAFIVAAELHQRAPVRTVNWYKNGQPKGGPVKDPYIPLVAYTEDQSETTIYSALKAILERSKLAKDFDIGLERIMRRDGTGKAEALAAEPNARDGARTTYQVFEETHRWTTPRLKRAYQTMMLNIPKRRTADAWSLEVTTAYAPGEGSIAEATMEHARAVADGRVKDTRLFFSHRQAPDDADLSSPEGLRAAVLEATGEVAAAWSDVDGICSQFSDPNLDHSTLCRLWLNQIHRPTDRAFDVERWKALGHPRDVAPGSLITLGFDGARSEDATAIVGTEVETGYQFLVGLWERPFAPEGEGWGVPEQDVDDAMHDAFDRFDVWRLYADPPYWRERVAAWVGEFGEQRVIEWHTNRPRKMSDAVMAFAAAIAEGDLSHDGNAELARHVGNAYRRQLNLRDDKGERVWAVQKDAKNSPNKIDAAMAAILSWEARRDALASGVAGEPARSVYDERAERGEEILRWL